MKAPHTNQTGPVDLDPKNSACLRRTWCWRSRDPSEGAIREFLNAPWLSNSTSRRGHECRAPGRAGFFCQLKGKVQVNSINLIPSPCKSVTKPRISREGRARLVRGYRKSRCIWHEARVLTTATRATSHLPNSSGPAVAAAPCSLCARIVGLIEVREDHGTARAY